jgi:hypothetical protein
VQDLTPRTCTLQLSSTVLNTSVAARIAVSASIEHPRSSGVGSLGFSVILRHTPANVQLKHRIIVRLRERPTCISTPLSSIHDSCYVLTFAFTPNLS